LAELQRIGADRVVFGFCGERVPNLAIPRFFEHIYVGSRILEKRLSAR